MNIEEARMKGWTGWTSPLALADEKAESFGHGFRWGFAHGEGAAALERERAAELSRPIPRGINPPALLAPTRCRVLKAFYVGGGKVAAPGADISLPLDDARSMAAIGRVEILP